MAKKTDNLPKENEAEENASGEGILTPKQEIFVLEYIKDFNATKAATAAGYSKKTAQQMGAENLTKPVIQNAIKAAIEARKKRVEVDSDWVLRRLIGMANADLDDIITADGGIRDITQWPKPFRKGLVSGIEVDEIKEKDDSGKFITVGHTKKIKLADRLRVIEMLGRHLGFFEKDNAQKSINIHIDKDDNGL